MVESFLVEGRQDLQDSGPPGPLTYGQSITDGCIDWPTTEALIRETHAALAGRRGRAG